MYELFKRWFQQTRPDQGLMAKFGNEIVQLFSYYVVSPGDDHAATRCSKCHRPAVSSPCGVEKMPLR